ncbi:MAG: molybdopterin-containing oxidoreductase family protein [Mycobacterium leprae]
MVGELAVKHAVCPHDCWDTCSMLVHVKDGQAVRVMGNPDHPVTRGYLCVKTNQYLERVYSPDRVLYPMRRTGPKGSGQFQRITWDEALTEIATRFKAVAAEFGPEAILPYSYAGTIGVLHYGSMDRRFFHKLAATQLERTICASAGTEAIISAMGGRQGPDPEDMVHAKLIVVWGVNVISSNTHQWPIIQEARRRGAKLVVIDPYRYKGAREADWHIQIRPGTDTAFVLGVMHVLMAEDLLDHDYIEQYTTGFEALQERVADWTPERAAEVTGIPPEEIRRFARLWYDSRPGVLRVGYGLQRHTNGGTAIRAICMLPALTGHWRDVGGGFLLSQSSAYGFNSKALERPDLMPAPAPRSINMIELGKALTEVSEPPVKALFVYNCNPAATAPNQNKVLRGLSREDLFTVVHEQLFTDTCKWADLVLPATTQLEHMDLMYSYWHLHLQLNEAAIQPLGEAIPNTELFRRLAAAMGFTDPCFKDSDEDLVRQALSSESPTLNGITLERLQQEHSIKLERAMAPFAHGGFATRSGKVELYAEQLVLKGLDPVLAYVPAAESPDGSPELAARYPLQLVSPAAHHFLNTTFANLPTLMSREKVPTLYLNPVDAAARFIETGDWVRVFNDRGSVRLRVEVGDWSKPGVAITPTIWWPRFMPDGVGINVLTTDHVADMGGGASFHTNLVQVEKSAAPEGTPWVPGPDRYRKARV